MNKREMSSLSFKEKAVNLVERVSQLTKGTLEMTRHMERLLGHGYRSMCAGDMVVVFKE
ncbi:MAG: hypothetical protein NPIRA06_29440 [Nitrospirales bacterium]|nr:MAG: hypothetical protein NPIRA06_29440 [Nitrospirales bacterium]